MVNHFYIKKYLFGSQLKINSSMQNLVRYVFIKNMHIGT